MDRRESVRKVRGKIEHLECGRPASPRQLARDCVRIIEMTQEVYDASEEVADDLVMERLALKVADLANATQYLAETVHRLTRLI